MTPKLIIIFLTTSAVEELKTLRSRSRSKPKIPEEWDLEKLVMKRLDETREAWLTGLDDSDDDGDIFSEDFLF